MPVPKNERKRERKATAPDDAVVTAITVVGHRVFRPGDRMSPAEAMRLGVPHRVVKGRAE